MAQLHPQPWELCVAAGASGSASGQSKLGQCRAEPRETLPVWRGYRRVKLSGHPLLLNLFLVRMALLMLLSVTTYKTQHLQLVSEVPAKHLQTTDQHDLLFCTDPPCRKPEPFISCLLAYPPLSWPYYFFLVVFWNLWLWCAQNTPFNKCQEQIKEN